MDSDRALHSRVSRWEVHQRWIRALSLRTHTLIRPSYPDRLLLVVQPCQCPRLLSDWIGSLLPSHWYTILTSTLTLSHLPCLTRHSTGRGYPNPHHCRHLCKPTPSRLTLSPSRLQQVPVIPGHESSPGLLHAKGESVWGGKC